LFALLFIRTPYYSKNSLDYAAAVIKVITPFTTGSNRKPIAFVGIKEFPMDNEEVMVSGWGVTDVSQLRAIIVRQW